MLTVMQGEGLRNETSGQCSVRKFRLIRSIRCRRWQPPVHVFLRASKSTYCHFARKPLCLLTRCWNCHTSALLYQSAFEKDKNHEKSLSNCIAPGAWFLWHAGTRSGQHDAGPGLACVPVQGQAPYDE